MTVLRIDPELARLAYRCFPDGCPRGRTCCVGLAVEVTRREVRVVDSLMDELARVVPALRRGRGFVNVFDDGEAGSLQIEPRDEAGTCPFLFARKGRALCAIHHVALAGGRAVADLKPRACRHWPLVLEARRGRVWVGVHPSAQQMGCVAPIGDLPGQPTVRRAFASEIDEIRRLVAGCALD